MKIRFADKTWFERLSVLRLAVLIMLCLGAGHAVGRTIVVPTEFPTIQGAVNAATTGDIISILPGTYSESVRILGGGKAGIALQGSNPATTIINPGEAGRGISVLVADNVSISKLTVTRGNPSTSPNSPGFGGGIFVDGSNNVMISSSVLTNNTAVNGGGFASLNSTVTLTGNTIDANRATSATDGRGGGVFMYLTHGQVSNNVISNNTTSGPNAGPGGGMFLQLSDPAITGNTFSGNRTSGTQHYGGGLYILDSTNFTVSGNTFRDNKGLDGGGMAIIRSGAAPSNPTVTGNSFSGNDARWGGGIYGFQTSSEITNNTFSQNTAGLRVIGFLSGGGGILFEESPDAVFTGNTVTGNTALDWGGGINIYNSKGSGPTVSGNTVSQNRSVNGGGIAIALDSNPTISNNLITDNIATHIGGGITIGDRSNAIVKNNLAARNQATDSGGGIVVYSASSPQIINNTFYANRGAENFGGTIRTDGASPVLMNNIFHGITTVEAISANASTVQLLYNDFWNNKSNVLNLSSTISPDTGNITADPKFTNPASDNFHLQAGSPAKNSGNPVPSYNNPDGSRNTIGMFGGPGALYLQSICFFDWAQTNFPSLFAPPSAIAGTLATFYYRYYSQTNAFLATNSADNHLYYLGPLSGYAVFDAGALSGWLATAGCQ